MTDLVPLDQGGWPDDAAGVCGGQRCRQPLLWVVNEWGNRVPLNRDPDPAGGIVILTGVRDGDVWSRMETVRDRDRSDPPRYQLHRATCGDIGRWRNLQRTRPGAEL